MTKLNLSLKEQNRQHFQFSIGKIEDCENSNNYLLAEKIHPNDHYAFSFTIECVWVVPEDAE